MSSPQPPSTEPILQQRRVNMASTSPAARASSATTATSATTSTASSRGSPYLPTARESLLLAIFPSLLLFGMVYSVLSPQTRAAAAAAGAGTSSQYPQSPAVAPSYFARKNNMVNVFFVKRGWFWITVTFFAFVATQPYFFAGAAIQKQAPRKTLFGRRTSAALRWALVTGWWILVTQWCFGPALIDRSFRLTGGGCEALQALADDIEAGAAQHGHASPKGAQILSAAATSSACRHAGGRWSGGHDISGHVFLLTLGTTFLVQEMGWVLWRKACCAGGGASSTGVRTVDARTIVMSDGAVKSAEVEASLGSTGAGAGTGTGTEPAAMLPAVLVTRFAAVVVGLSMWMLLMTAIYFHTWPEKLTGLIVALTGFYVVYVVPRFVPALRHIIGLPGL